MHTIGDRISHIRKAKGLSQGDLGNLTETHRTTINSIERNGENITAKKLLSISRALGCSLNYLITGEEEQTFDISHIMGDNNSAQTYDNMDIKDSLSHQHELITKYIYSLHRSSFIDEVPATLERSLKLTRNKMDDEDFLLPQSTEPDIMIKWINNYMNVYNKRLTESVLECYKIRL